MKGLLNLIDTSSSSNTPRSSAMQIKLVDLGTEICILPLIFSQAFFNTTLNFFRRYLFVFGKNPASKREIHCSCGIDGVLSDQYVTHRGSCSNSSPEAVSV